jgi:signal peptidase I
VARGRALGCTIELVQTVVLTALIFIGIQAFVAQPYRVQQGSMEHTLEPNQYVLVDKLTPHLGGYHRGDIVVFAAPAALADEGDTPFIKRIVGLPGEIVRLAPDGHVYVDGNRLDESYVFDGQQTTASGGPSEWTVPPDEVFVLGDHREASADSRVFGPVPESSIIGRAWLRYWPLPFFGVLPTPAYAAPAS